MYRSTRSTVALLCTAILCAALLVGCGPKTGESTPTAGGETTAPPTPTPSEGTPGAPRELTAEEKTAEVIARTFVKKSSTYAHDGSGLTYQSIDVLSEGAYRFTYAFQSASAGYGDRAGQFTAQVITPHTIVVGVTDGAVVFAEVDGRYNELTRVLTEPEPAPAAPTPEPAAPSASDAAAIARSALEASNTYAFDGSGLALSASAALVRDPTVSTHLFTFTSRNSGYGTRTGKEDGVATEHTARVVVQGTKAVSIILDGTWNELRGAPQSNGKTNRLLGDTCGHSGFRCGTGLSCLSGETATDIGVCIPRELGFTCVPWSSPERGIGCFRSTITNPGSDYTRYNGTDVRCAIDLQGNCKLERLG